jgi:hypothetical protein
MWVLGAVWQVQEDTCELSFYAWRFEGDEVLDDLLDGCLLGGGQWHNFKVSYFGKVTSSL